MHFEKKTIVFQRADIIVFNALLKNSVGFGRNI